MDWDDAYSNAGGEAFPARWAARAAVYRVAARGAEIGLAYGEHARETMDVFHPEDAPRGLAVFVYGDYRMAFDAFSWSDRVGAVTCQIARTVVFAAARIPGPIRLAGHSAGGHLVSQMLCRDGPLDGATADRIERVVSISGLHDLRPLRATRINATLGMTAADAWAESPALSAPRSGARITAWVGAEERPEFLRQSGILAGAWGAAGAETKLVVDPGRHHFDVIDDLADPDSALTLEFAE